LAPLERVRKATSEEQRKREGKSKDREEGIKRRGGEGRERRGPIRCGNRNCDRHHRYKVYSGE
jgi:hypothetical protein